MWVGESHELRINEITIKDSLYSSAQQLTMVLNYEKGSMAELFSGWHTQRVVSRGKDDLHRPKRVAYEVTHERPKETLTIFSFGIQNFDKISLVPVQLRKCVGGRIAVDNGHGWR